VPVVVSSVSRRARLRRFWASLNFPFKGARIVCLLVGFPSTIKRFVLQVGFPSTFKTVCSVGRFPVGCQNCLRHLHQRKLRVSTITVLQYFFKLIRGCKKGGSGASLSP
jgi:hypothetical protein